MIMGKIWFSKLKSYGGSSRYYDFCMNSKRGVDHLNARPMFGYLGQNYDTNSRILSPESSARVGICKPNNGSPFSPTTSNSRVLSSLYMTPMLGGLPYSSFTGSSGGNKGLEVPEQESSTVGNTDVGGSIDSSEWVDRLKEGWQSVVDAVGVTGQKAEEISDQLTPYAEKVLDSHPYLNDVVVPVSSTVVAAILAWAVMPTILKRLHIYCSRGSAALVSGLFAVEVPYEKSVWGALEDPVRYMMTFMAIYQMSHLVAPKAGLCPLIGHSWNGALVLSGVWFLQRWKTNVFARALADQNLPLLDRERLLTLHRVSSLGLFAIGVMAFAEASGVPIQSIVTVGGIGGVATAYAAKDILVNVISGLSMHYSKPFSLGDNIKAGSIEGQVVEMDFTTTSLLNEEKFSVLVPNAMTSSQGFLHQLSYGCTLLEILQKVGSIIGHMVQMQWTTTLFNGERFPLVVPNPASSQKKEDSELKFKFRLISQFGYKLTKENEKKAKEAEKAEKAKKAKKAKVREEVKAEVTEEVKAEVRAERYVAHCLVPLPRLPVEQATPKFDEKLLSESDKRELNNRWINLENPKRNSLFWNKEYNKHGTRQNRFTQEEYVKGIIMLHKRYDMPRFLKELDQKYSFQRQTERGMKWMIVDSDILEQELQNHFRGHVEVIPTTDDKGNAYIRELAFTLDKDLNPKFTPGEHNTYGAKPVVYLIADFE